MKPRFFAALLLLSVLPAAARAAGGKAEPLDGYGVPAFRGRPQVAELTAPVVYWEETRATPRPLRIHCLAVSYASASVRLATVIADDPDGEGPADATLVQPAGLAGSAGLTAAVNCAPWGRLSDEDQGPWREGEPVMFVSWCFDGARHVGADRKNGFASLWMTRDGEIRIGRPADKAEAIVAAGGFSPVLLDGQVRGSAEQLHPRTAAGIDPTAKRLILVVVDGRRNGVSEGMTEREVGAFLKELGCRSGINLDGGGSSIMLVRDERDELKVMNQPSGGEPRPLPAVFGVVRADSGAVPDRSAPSSAAQARAGVAHVARGGEPASGIRPRGEASAERGGGLQ